MFSLTPLEQWIRQKAGIGPHVTGPFYLKALETYQVEKLNETIEHARRNSPFYRHFLASLPCEPLSTPSDLGRFPFTFPSDIARKPVDFLAVRQDDIARIVTLRTSGSTGESKRLFFTDADIELTVDFFHHGMSALVRDGQRVMILLPGDKPDSVGDLLSRGLERLGVRSLVYGPVTDAENAAEAMVDFEPHCLVGIPTQVLALAYASGAGSSGISPDSVLLSTDYCPRAISRTLEAIWQCAVFTHYGMTETGLGGGVECSALSGYHLREADLLFEVVHPASGEPCNPGVAGEVVFTTLTRRGMPLIRYRTGDMACILDQPCGCKSVLRRMGRVMGRLDGITRLGSGNLTLPDMDEALFQIPGLLDYGVTLLQERNERYHLRIEIRSRPGAGLSDGQLIRALEEIEAIRNAMESGFLDTPEILFRADWPWSTTGVAKRRIHVVGAGVLPGET